MEAKHFDKIEAYLAGEMTEAEAKAFDAQLLEDQTLVEDIEVHQIAHNAMEILIEDDLRSQFKEWQAEEETTTAAPSSATASKVVTMTPRPTAETATTTRPPAKRRSLFSSLAAAASVALVLGFFTFQYSNKSSNALENSYSEYSMPDVLRGGNATATTPLAEGLNAYEEENYDKAIEFYKAIPTTNPRYNEAQFYLAHSYHKNNDFAQAIAQFESVIEAGDIRYKEQAEWYQLLSFVANEQQDASFDALMKKLLTDSKHGYHQKAQQLNSDLNSWW